MMSRVTSKLSSLNHGDFVLVEAVQLVEVPVDLSSFRAVLNGLTLCCFVQDRPHSFHKRLLLLTRDHPDRYNPQLWCLKLKVTSRHAQRPEELFINKHEHLGVAESANVLQTQTVGRLIDTVRV